MKLELDCSDCADLLSSQPLLIGACASAGIEHGKSTRQMLMEYLQGYHARGHKAERE